MVGGTFTAFVLARFDVDGTLDDSFGTGGTVTTNIGGEFSQQEALGVAIQPDPDRIVVAGYLRNEVTVACYQPDGQLDETFGTDGVVTGIAAGSPTTWPSIRTAGSSSPAGPRCGPPRRGRLRRSVRRPAPRGWTDRTEARAGRSGGHRRRRADQRGPERRRPAGRRDDRRQWLQPNPASGGVGIDHHTDIVRYQARTAARPGLRDGRHADPRRLRRCRPRRPTRRPAPARRHGGHHTADRHRRGASPSCP